jgi:hypothetical protein
MKQGAGLESATGYQRRGDKRNCFLSTTAAALVNSFSFFPHNSCASLSGAWLDFFFFFGGFEVSVLQ